MTDLVRRVRSMADDVGQQRGRPLLLAARTPFTVEDARFIGLDLENWLAEDLIDILISGVSSVKSLFRLTTFISPVHGCPMHGVSLMFPIDSWGH